MDLKTTFASWKTFYNWKGKPQREWNYLQNIHPTKDFCLEHIKDSHNLRGKLQLQCIKDLKWHFTKEDIQMPDSTWEDVQNSTTNAVNILRMITTKKADHTTDYGI